MVGLGRAGGMALRKYSKGMLQRLGIAQALINDPELVILDEPTNGLDPEGTLEVRALIPELAREGRTVLLCSHLLHEVEQVCDRVAIFQRGRIVARGATADLTAGGSVLEIGVDEREAALSAFAASPWAGRVQCEGELLRIAGAAEEGAAVNAFLAGHGLYASLIRPHRQSLEEAFLAITREAEGG
jgi:ABC-2 type transport system ATP-binding protein